MSLLLALALLSPAARAAEPAWTVSGDTAATLGGEAVLVYRAASAGGAKLAPDPLASGTTDFAVIAAEARPDGAWAWRVLPLNAGVLEFTARWTLDGKPAAALPARLRVDVPKVAPDAEISDIKPPRPAPAPLWPWLAAAALAAAGYAAWRRWKNRPGAAAPEVPGAAPPSPEAAVEKLLAELEASGLWERGEHAEYYWRLTEALKSYLEARYGEPATAMTSPEIGRLVKSREPDLRAAGTVREVLGRADLVKFARIKPDAGDGPRDVGLVRSVVRATTPSLNDAAAAPAGAAR